MQGGDDLLLALRRRQTYLVLLDRHICIVLSWTQQSYENICFYRCYKVLVLVLPDQFLNNVIISVKVKTSFLVMETPACIALIEDIQSIRQ